MVLWTEKNVIYLTQPSIQVKKSVCKLHIAIVSHRLYISLQINSAQRGYKIATFYAYTPG